MTFVGAITKCDFGPKFRKYPTIEAGNCSVCSFQLLWWADCENFHFAANPFWEVKESG